MIDRIGFLWNLSFEKGSKPPKNLSHKFFFCCALDEVRAEFGFMRNKTVGLYAPTVLGRDLF